MKNKILLVMLLSFWGLSALAQPFPVNLSNPLGSPRGSETQFSNDLVPLVQKSMPSFNEQELSGRLEKVARLMSNPVEAIKIRDYAGLQSFFQLPQEEVRPGTPFFHSKIASYGLDLSKGRLQLQKMVDQIPTMPLPEMQKLLPEMERRHQELLTKIGIDPTQIMFKKSFVRALQSAPREGTPPTTNVPAPTANGVLTEFVRGFQGIIIEGSEAKIISRNATILEAADLHWPALRFHPAVQSFEVKSKDILTGEIIRELKRSIGKEDKIALRMAVVLRPVMVDSKLVFIPALKVGMLSQRGEGGNEFYISLLKQNLPFTEEILKPEAPVGG